MKNPNNNIDPKKTFLLDNKSSDAFQENVMSPAFRRAVELAFCEFVMRISPNDLVAAPKIAGAKAFMQTLLNFGNPRELDLDSDDETNLTPT